MVFFFFSSRRRHTRFDCDWSSDVCSSDLGPLVTEEEVIKVVEFLKTQGKPAYNERILESPEERAELAEAEGEIDELYEEARRIVIEMGKASTSVLQRRLRIGYGRAASLLDAMA